MVADNLQAVRKNAARGIYPPDDMPNWVHPSSAGRARHHRRLFGAIVADGVVAGLMGAAVIAALFAVLGLATGRGALHVPAVLGAALFAGGGSEAAAPSPVLGYSVLHALVLMAIGIVMAAFARLAGAAQQGWYLGVVGLLFIAGHIVALPIWFGDAVQATLSPWLVSAGTTAGVVVISAYLWWRNPAIATAAREPDE
jgi:hypothetical protein